MNKEDQNTLTATHTGIWQENARSQRRVGKQESATNAAKWTPSKRLQVQVEDNNQKEPRENR